MYCHVFLSENSCLSMCMYVIYFSYVYILDDLRVYISLRVYIRSIHVDTAISLRLQKLLYMYVDV